MWWYSAWAASALNVIQGARIAGADMIIGVDLNNARKPMAEKFGLTHFVNPAEIGEDLVPYLVNLTDGGADYSFECIGQCERDAPGAGMLFIAAGHFHHHRRRRRRAGNRDASVPAGHRQNLESTAFGGARGRTDVPKIVDWYMDGKINIDDLITHVLPFEKINEGFELMRRGESIRSVVTY